MLDSVINMDQSDRISNFRLREFYSALKVVRIRKPFQDCEQWNDTGNPTVQAECSRIQMKCIASGEVLNIGK